MSECHQHRVLQSPTAFERQGESRASHYCSAANEIAALANKNMEERIAKGRKHKPCPVVLQLPTYIQHQPKQNAKASYDELKENLRAIGTNHEPVRNRVVYCSNVHIAAWWSVASAPFHCRARQSRVHFNSIQIYNQLLCSELMPHISLSKPVSQGIFFFQHASFCGYFFLSTYQIFSLALENVCS